MARRAFRIDKWAWSDKDFHEMNWHDVIIHGLATSNELISRGGEPRFKPQELLLDIDYVLNWREAYGERPHNDFWLSPATLVFADVSKLKAEFKREWQPALVIYTIGHEGRYWTVALDEGQIAFDAAGFSQYLRREPVLKSGYTYLSDSERGGFSFRRGRDGQTD